MKMMEIKVIHLGGEIIIARVIDETDNFITIEKPLSMFPHPEKGGLIFTPPLFVMVSGASKFDVQKSTIALITKAAESIESDYLTNTSEITAGIRNGQTGATTRKEKSSIITI
jgi:hypothetical protein